MRNVHVAAPGLSILSTLPLGKFGTMSGTSQATAFVTGAAALLSSQFKDKAAVDYKKVKAWILGSTKPLPVGETNKKVTYGMLSVPKSLSLATNELTGPATPQVAGKGKATAPEIALSPEKTERK